MVEDNLGVQMEKKIEEQGLARSLREQGYTIPEIEKRIGCPRSSISNWTRDVVISIVGKERLSQILEVNREKKIRNIPYDKEILTKLIQEGYSIRKLADEFKCSTKIVKRMAKDCGLIIQNKEHGKTKDKGDKGVGFIIAKLMENGIHVALPISEHLPFDLIAIKENAMCRVSVKYRERRSNGIDLTFQHVWMNSKGVQHKLVDKETFDATAIYCPDTRESYFIKNSEIEGHSICLRFERPKNNQEEGIRYGKDYIDPNRLF